MPRAGDDSDAEADDAEWAAEDSDFAGDASDNDTADSENEICKEDVRCAKAPGRSTALPPRPTGASQKPARPSAGVPLRPSRPAVSRLNDEDDEQLSEEALQRRREENIKALVNNSLQTCRQPLMSKFLTVLESQVVLRKPFQSPMQGAPAMSDALRRKLVARRHFVPWGSSTPLPIPTMPAKQASATPSVPEPPPELPAPPPPEPTLPEGIEPLILWQAPPACPEGPGEVAVDNMLVRFLRPHQREGVQFMFDCVTGQRLEGKQGCILADDMGLGKTLQGITLLWTLLTGGHPLLGGKPIARRAIIVCPTSLVSNWDNECTKWLEGRLKTLAMCESSREDVVANIGMFLHPSNVYKVLIISYETFRMHAERFQVPHACDLLVCDEAHRLKNDATLTNRALDNLPCKRRVLLSGTPMQNHLDEFFAMVDFCNPGVLGPPAQFRKHYELPILAGREPDAAPEEVVLGEERSRELSGLTNNFILRRTNKLLSQHLPPKVIEVVCCRLTELQRQLYCHFLQSKAARRVLNGRTSSGVLSAITSLKKLCNHPKLIYDAVHSKVAAMADEGESGRADGFEDVGSLFPPGLFDNGRAGRGGMAHGWEAVSGKMAVLARMLHVLYTETTDRIVLVSNYTSTLDLFAQLCRERGYPFVRLDGTTTINKRQKLVKVFNDPAERQFAFLLSSKAGGCGLNLIGANRLVLFDPDWNPANDQQAAARVWRDGQRKRVYVYRFLSTGSIEEKVYQRQLSKEGLKQLVSKNGKAAANVMTAEDLRELFTLNPDTWSDTYDFMCGGPGTAVHEPASGVVDLAYDEEDDEDGGGGGAAAKARGTQQAGSKAPAGKGGVAAEDPLSRLPPVHKRQSGEPAEEDLANWGHHPSPETVPDAVMRRVAAPDVSFVFSCSVAGKAIEGSEEEERRLSEGPAVAPGAAGSTAGLSSGAGRAANARNAMGASRPSRGQAGSSTPAPNTARVAAVMTPAPTLPGPAATGSAGARRPSGAATASVANGTGPRAATGGAAPVAQGSNGARTLPPSTRPPTTSRASTGGASTGVAAVKQPCETPTAIPATQPIAEHLPPTADRSRAPSQATRQALVPQQPTAPQPAANARASTAGVQPSGQLSAAGQRGSGATPQGASSRPPSSVTGAVVSNVTKAPPLLTAAVQAPAATGAARTADAQPKPPAVATVAQASKPTAAAGGVRSAPGDVGASALPRPQNAAPAPRPSSGGPPSVLQAQPQVRPGAALQAAPASGVAVGPHTAGPPLVSGSGGMPGAAAGGGSKASRAREDTGAREGSAGGIAAGEAPQPKRPRAPGWYIDDDEDFL